MRRQTLLIILLIASLQAMAQKKKALFIICDGMTADVFERLDLPGFKTIINDGGSYIRAHQGGDKGTYNETPTISAPGYNNILTGTWKNKHNVIDNKISAQNYNYPSILRLFKEQYPDKKIGIFSAWIDNRTKLLGENLPQTNHLKLDYIFDGYEKDTVRFSKVRGADMWKAVDDQIAIDASATIREHAPDLSWIYLEEPDGAGHAYGDGPRYEASFHHIDDEVAKIYAAIKYREQKFKEDWLLIVTTDHGRTETDGKSHGGQTDRQRNTWIVLNKKVNNYANTYDAAAVDIVPTIARFLDVTPPKNVQYELDGTPLTGPVSAANLHAYFVQGKLVLTWKALQAAGNVKVWVTSTNNVKTGGNDEYTLLGEFPVAQKYAAVDVSKHPSAFYKLVLEAPNNLLNTWVTVPEQEAAKAR